MSNETAVARLTHLAQDDTDGVSNARRCLVRKTLRHYTGNLAAAAGDCSGTIMSVTKAIDVQACRIQSLIAVAADANDTITATIGHNDGAGGGITDIAHWATTNAGAEGELAALTKYDMAATGAHTAFVAPFRVAAGQCLTYTQAHANAGKACNIVIEIEYDEVG